MRFTRVRQVRPGALKPALPNVMGEIVANRLEQLLQVTLGDSFGLRDARRHQFGIVEPALDGLADPVQQRSLSRAGPCVGGRGRELMRERQKQIDERVRDRIPLGIAQAVERARGRVQQAREHVGEAAWRDHAGLAETRSAREPAAQRFRHHRQHDRAHVALEHDAPVAAPRQQHEMPDRNDAMAARAPEHHAVLDRHQGDRKVFDRLRERTDGLRARGHSRQCDAGGMTMRCRRVSVEKGVTGSRLQADRREHVPPGFRAVVLRVGLACEGAEAHWIDPGCGGSKQPLCQTHAIVRRRDGAQMRFAGHVFIREMGCPSKC
ncbi:hypothetical protein S23_37180 [Bradyrhizobium cosmicum]|uniref:Uncharacterized protein n=1 Tax=Bradyrhizobium cosmicum TaxID=1404864 RepID=A0AAI8QCZ5_9BRAD|nr:hypothetical protein S23_37180 [Bradyrhizobium cosmicum]